MKKLVIISMTASPHQVRFVPYLAQYFDVQHYFYSRLGGRQDFWKVDLGSRCHILPCWFKWRAKYLTFSIWAVLRKEKPDILLLGGFSVPSNYLAYLWARMHGVPVVVFTERSRNKRGELREYDFVWRVIRFLYRNVTRVMTSAEDIVPQFRDTFHFGNKVVAARYPTDIDRYFAHPPRMPKESYTLIYPNRMTDIYNPIEAVEIFADVLKRHPKTKLKMNASGELRPQVERRIDELGIRCSIDFLDSIKSWDDLGNVYAACDIMYLPAKFSNGNYTIWECRASGMGCIISDKVLGEFASEMRNANVGFVVPLSREVFVEKICWYIEHPGVLVEEAKVNRDQLRYLTHEETAKMYNQILKDLR